MMSRLGDFSPRRNKLNGEYLVEGHSHRSDTSRVTSHQSSTLSVFFSNFYSRCSRCNDVINSGLNPLWGNFQTDSGIPLSLFPSLNDAACLEWSGIVQWRSWKAHFLKIGLGEMSLPQLRFTLFLRNLRITFSIFFLNDYVWDERSVCCSEATFSPITPWRPLGFPKLF